MDLVSELKQGKRRAIARAISAIENDEKEAKALIKRIFKNSGKSITIESVGAGQTEVDISRIVDVTVVVFNPNTGDNIQTIKAGLSEIGDVYLINKSDLQGANQLFDSVRDFIGMSDTNPTIMLTSAKSNKGITELAKKLKELVEAKRKTKKSQEQSRLEGELKDIVLNNVKNKVSTMLDSSNTFAKYLKKVQSRELDPFEAAEKISKMIK